MTHGESTTASSGIRLGRRISAAAVMIALGVIAGVVIVPVMIAVAVTRRSGGSAVSDLDYDVPVRDHDVAPIDSDHLAPVTEITSARSARAATPLPAAIAL